MNERIANDLKVAMKNGDEFRLSVLRMLKSALQLEAISKKHELSDDEVMSVIKKQVRNRRRMRLQNFKYNKLEEALKSEQEIEILNAYLPEEMSEEEISKVIDEVFADLKPSSMKDMGLVMKELNAKLTNADMSLVSKLVKERLS